MYSYLYRHVVAHWRNQYCCGKEKKIAYSEFVFVAVSIKLAGRMRHIFMSPSRPHKRLPRYKLHDFLKKKKSY
jgi:hypothetical protein